MSRVHILSPLNKTWLFDLDGTIAKHNGYKSDGFDTLLPGAKEFFALLPKGDTVIILTSRSEEERSSTEDFLIKNNIPYKSIIFGLPYGERVLVNDRKPSGLNTAVVVNTTRDEFMTDMFEINPLL